MAGAATFVTRGIAGANAPRAGNPAKNVTAAQTLAKLAFRQRPSGAFAGARFEPAIQVLVQDAAGQLVTSAKNRIRVNLAGVFGLKGTLMIAARNGIATFSDLTFGTPGTYTLVASSPGLASATSTSFVISLQGPLATPTSAARFLDQTSFGPTADTLNHVEQVGLQAALLEQFNQNVTLYTEPSSPNSECPARNIACTQSDFFKIAAFGSDQLRQRVAMALSEIWVVSLNQDNAMPFYLNTLANDAFTNYRQIMQDATLSPAMGSYLNMLNSAKPSIKQIANENFGREMMQLFSIGTNQLNSDGTEQSDSNGNPIPAYSESQVEAFARAYTGWTFANADGSSPTNFNFTPNWTHYMVPVESQHDTTEKIILSRTILPAGQTAEQDLDDALNNIIAQPNMGPFLCRRLIQHLVSGNPSPGYIQRVSDIFADNGSGARGDMKAVLTAIIMDPEARAGDAQSADQADTSPTVDGGHLREPLLWTVSVERALGATQEIATDPYPFVVFMSWVLQGVRETPFSQTSVFNYYSPEYTVPQTRINSPEFQMENTGIVIPWVTLADIIVRNGLVHDGLNMDLTSNSVVGKKAAAPEQLTDYLGMLFMHSQMPSDMRTGLIAAIETIPASDPQLRAEVAVYLVVTSAQYKIIH